MTPRKRFERWRAMRRYKAARRAVRQLAETKEENLIRMAILCILAGREAMTVEKAISSREMLPILKWVGGVHAEVRRLCQMLDLKVEAYPEGVDEATLVLKREPARIPP